tara:strand:- start:665 stop:889 length:225 start_codon:yes stop_codon:yes gene_type:complete
MGRVLAAKQAGALVLTWHPGQNSIRDEARIPAGRYMGNVVVQMRQPDGALSDVPCDVTFAFAHLTFRPDGDIVF